MVDTPKIVAVFGSGVCDTSDPLWQMAYQTGEYIAEAGFTLVNGGYGGTMEATAMGAAQHGGEVIGVTCTAFGSGVANRFVSRVIETDSLMQRLTTLVELADAYIVLPGSTGTMLELACVWEHSRKAISGRATVVLLGDYWKPMLDFVKLGDADADRSLVTAKTASQAVKIIIESGI